MLTQNFYYLQRATQWAFIACLLTLSGCTSSLKNQKTSSVTTIPSGSKTKQEPKRKPKRKLKQKPKRKPRLSQRSKKKVFVLGKFKITYYWLAQEKYKSKGKPSQLYVGKKFLTTVSESFLKAIRFQGSGLLKDGRLVQYLRKCRFKRKGCLQVRLVDQSRFPMGVGAAGIALRPFYSLAVDPRRIPYGTLLYIPRIQRHMKRYGLSHDGCFFAHDSGGRILENRLDLFVGTKDLYNKNMGKGVPTYAKVYLDHPSCQSNKVVAHSSSK